jgi:hypothetical protein
MHRKYIKSKTLPQYHHLDITVIVSWLVNTYPNPRIEKDSSLNYKLLQIHVADRWSRVEDTNQWRMNRQGMEVGQIYRRLRSRGKRRDKAAATEGRGSRAGSGNGTERWATMPPVTPSRKPGCRAVVLCSLARKTPGILAHRGDNTGNGKENGLGIEEPGSCTRVHGNWADTR